MSPFRHFRVCKSNKAQWLITWSAVLCHLTGRITSLLDLAISTVIFTVRVSPRY
jgi:hypothetical protein